MEITYRLMHIKGIVQGVGMRFFISRTAKQFDLKGYVKNLNNGQVECLAIGRIEAVDALEKAIKKDSPGSVDSLESQTVSPAETFESFQVRF